ncbi:Rho GTPase activation protein [Xylaria nigripes]|nr:Rho GTPase activation protein [Xylaria nigripes]
MDSQSLASDCTALHDKISKLLSTLADFVRHVREARSDLDAVSRELHSLQTVLGLLKEDAVLLPLELAEQAPTIIEQCSHMVDQLDEYVSTLHNLVLSKQEKRTQWLGTGRIETASFRAALEAHKVTIGLALDLVEATTPRDSTHDTGAVGETDSEVVADVSRILMQMDEIRLQYPEEYDEFGLYFSLHEYMDDLKRYAEAIIEQKETNDEAESQVGSQTELQFEQPERETEAGPFLGDNQMFKAFIGDGPDHAIDVDIEPADPRMYIPSRAPTPPPRDAKRLETAQRKITLQLLEGNPYPLKNPSEFTETWSSERSPKFSESNRISTKSSMGRGIRRFLTRKYSMSETIVSKQGTDSSQTVLTDARQGTSFFRTGVERRRIMGRLSMYFNRQLDTESLAEIDRFVSKPVFGVSLHKSMQVAKGTSKTHHGISTGSSRRDFPLCLQKCCFFLRSEGLTAPDIFAEPGDIFRVSKLKEIFSKGPTYGADVNFANYTVYDAADLIMLYLSQLPRPLISESLAKRWTSFSRRATPAESHAVRLDRCINFWEDALSGLRGPSRSLFKLLLNLWADIITAKDQNDMTAEKLAGVVLKPLLHISSGQCRADYMLSLAFLIRKRAEYMRLLEENQFAVKRISRAAW